MSVQPLLDWKIKTGSLCCVIKLASALATSYVHGFMSKLTSVTKKYVFVRGCGDAIALLIGGIHDMLHLLFISPTSQHLLSSSVAITT